MKKTLAVILGGGAGTRLHPLTEHRSKPAVPFGGKFRLIDVPMSNCLNSGLNRVFVMTQFNSASLNSHVTATYRFSLFSRGFVDILAAEQTPSDQNWFQGTADAVRRMLGHLEDHQAEQILILSGDQLYQMDFDELITRHRASGAALTIATTPVNARDATSYGIMQTDESGRIVRFVEKPPAAELDGLESSTGEELEDQGRVYLASMGIYVFERETLFELLRADPEHVDFGRHVIPKAIETLPVHSFAFAGYWEDIGTIPAFFEANLQLVDPMPKFNLYDAERPLFTRPRMLPPVKLRNVRAESCVIVPGVVLEGCRLRRSLIGVRSVVRPDADLSECILMGADEYETPDQLRENRRLGRPPVGIGIGCRMERAIIDKGARIGNQVIIEGREREDSDSETHAVRDNIVIVKKGAIIPDETVL